MSFRLLSPWMLLALAALALPLLIHLLNRRRYDVVDWGAMQFLQVSDAARRRLFLEDALLMALRMGLIALLVLAVAAPEFSTPALTVSGRPPRDIVLVLDGSQSMGLADRGGKTAHDAARAWAAAFAEEFAPGDRVALLVARDVPVAALADFTDDPDRLREALAKLPAPRGGCDWPRAVREAHRLLAERGQHAHRDIVLLTDAQRHGWADALTIFQWQMLAEHLRSARGEVRPRVRVIDVAGERDADPPNYSLAPLTAARSAPRVGQRVTIKTAVRVSGGMSYEPPHRIRLEVNGKFVAHLPAPPGDAATRVQVPLTFTHRFDAPGWHLVTLTIEPDPPPEARPPGYIPRDTLAADNRQDLAVEVLEALPVLLVDGDAELSPESSTYFLLKALSPPAGAKAPAGVLARAVPVGEFAPGLLTRDLDPGRPGSRPRVLVLADVPRLTEEQEEAVSRFLAGGGGVLVVAGERVEQDFYNERLHRGGAGWLPARLDAVADERDRPDRAAALDVRRFHHPALDLFRDEPNCTLGKARFPRWWKVKLPPKGGAVPVALLTTDDPLLVERPHGAGRVLLWTAPLDRSWGATLPAVWEYPVLAHELVGHLAGGRSADHNLRAGQAIRYDPPAAARGDKTPELCLLFPPEGPPRLFRLGVEAPAEALWRSPGAPVLRLRTESVPLHHAGLNDPGVYRVEAVRASGDQPPRLTPVPGSAAYYVVQPDAGESDLTPLSEKDRRSVADLMPLEYANERRPGAAAWLQSWETHDVWWWFLLGVIVLLCSEVWMTRRMVKRRAA